MIKALLVDLRPFPFDFIDGLGKKTSTGMGQLNALTPTSGVGITAL